MTFCIVEIFNSLLVILVKGWKQKTYLSRFKRELEERNWTQVVQRTFWWPLVAVVAILTILFLRYEN